MKIKCGIVFNTLQTIISLSEKPMKVSLTAKMLRLADDLAKENIIIEKQRRELLEQYGKKDENNKLITENGNIIFSDENKEKLQNELKELSELEIEITDRNITQKELEDSNLELTMSQYSILKEFIHESD